MNNEPYYKTTDKKLNNVKRIAWAMIRIIIVVGIAIVIWRILL